MSVLSTQDLSVHYGTTVAVQGVDLVVEPGELLAVVGRNGAGKSSLLSTLAGAYAHHGSVRWSVRRDQIAYVPQRAHPRWDMPLEVRHVVAAGCLRGQLWWQRPTAGERARVQQAIERLGLTELARRPVRTLSGGQAQRVLLARAVAQHPRVLLLEEPYDGLDRTHVDILNTVLTDLANEGVAVIAAIHELGIVRDTYSRVLALDGRPLADGHPDEVFTPAGLGRLFGIVSAA